MHSDSLLLQAPVKPKFSIITVTFNAEDTIAECIKSVNLQSWPFIEHIFVDGASSDNTIGIINQTSRRETLILSEPDRGIYDALNKGIYLASGDIIGFLHADDLLFDENIISDIAHAFIDKNPDAVYGNLIYVNRSKPSIRIRFWRSCRFSTLLLFLGWMPPHPTLYVRRSAYLSANMFDESFKISADYLSILRFFKSKNFSSFYLNLVFVKMRLGGISNRSIKTIFLKSREDFRALRLAKFPILLIPFTLLLKNFSKIPQFFKF